MSCSVIGFNCPTRFAVVGEKVFIPAGNGVVISERGGSVYWLPSDGLYEIDCIAVCPQQKVLCITEKCLSVSLLFFYAGDLRKIDEVRGITSVAVQDLCFSMTGESLFVLCSMPTFCVKVLQCSSDCMYAVAHTVDLPGTQYQSLLSISVSLSPGDFAVVGATGFSGFTRAEDNTYHEFARFDDLGELFTCGSAVEDGVVLGTTSGNVCKFTFSDGTAVRMLCVGREDGGVCAVYMTGDRCYIGTEAGMLYTWSHKESVFSHSVCLAGGIRRICAVKESGLLCIGADSGLFLCNGETAQKNPTVLRRRFAEVIRCMSVSDEGGFVGVCRNGAFFVFSAEADVYTLESGSPVCVIDACLCDPEHVAMMCVDGLVRCYHVRRGTLSWSLRIPDCIPQLCVSDGCGKLVMCDDKCIYFVATKDDAYVALGHFLTEVHPPVVRLRWVPQSDTFMVACEYGELYLLRFPGGGETGVAYTMDTVVEGLWHLDCPIVEMIPCFAENDVLNILVHSADKETKLYALDRRRDAQGKILRPLFLMRDHESGGTCLEYSDVKAIVSGGKDGRVVLRDITHYQMKLAPIPPSKEKRRPILEATARHFAGGGITTMCVAGGFAVCGGRDTVIRLVSLGKSVSSLRWMEPTWVVRCSDEVSPHGVNNDDPMLQYKEERDVLLREVGRLQAEWKVVMAQNDADVPVDAFLIPEKQAEFKAECAEAVSEMKVSVHYNHLRNEYIQDVIKRQCWDSMSVVRAKVVSLTDATVEVHNFHLLHSTIEKQTLVRKAAFMRKLQRRARHGHTFTDVGVLQTSASCPGESDGTDAGEIESLLYNPYDVYTHSRTVLQMILLKGLIVSLKDAFNSRFNGLREQKRQALAMIDERNCRCVKIMKQLGETDGKLFHAVIDREEDPKTVFEVLDDELPDNAAALVVPLTDTGVVSPSNEAALKLWMDGLEKDVELLQVNVQLPDFADETSEAFVTADDRTEGQVKAMEVYEKMLREETEQLNIRKDALRNEFQQLQRENCLAASTIDAELEALRRLRLSIAERIHETELRLVKLLQHLLVTSGALAEFADYSAQKIQLEREMKHTRLLLEHRRAAANAILTQLEKLEDDNNEMIAAVHHESPFADAEHGEKLHKRFGRWKRKFDVGKADLPSEHATDGTPEDLWKLFCEQCERVAVVRAHISEAEAAHDAATETFQAAEAACDAVSQRIADVDLAKERLKCGLVSSLLNTQNLYHLHQGQIQDETATVASDFATSCLRWTDDVRRYNQLIVESDKEKVQLMQRVAQRCKDMKHLDWETQRLRYCVGTLQMELRQLHTLRVTRQMQEWLKGDAVFSEERELQRIDRHIAIVHANLEKRRSEFRSAARRLQQQIAERQSENQAIGDQVAQLQSNVTDMHTVRGIVDAHADESHRISTRMREIYEASELEELARSQQEDLLRLKKEVDRLRERTFPSFAVVSKRTV